MKSIFTIRFPFSITIRLLLSVLLLLCIPIALVGYLSYRTSVERVVLLSRNEQILQAKSAANAINNIFNKCRMDLDTLSVLFKEDLSTGVGGLLFQIGTQKDREGILSFLHDYIFQSPYYLRVRLFDASGQDIISPGPVGMDGPMPFLPRDTLMETPKKGEPAYVLSRISYSEFDKGFIIQVSRPVSRVGDIFIARLVLDLNFSKVIELVLATRTGKLGFTFLVDKSGRTIAHPLFEPYQYDLSRNCMQWPSRLSYRPGGPPP
jgi:hypothetical protein